MSDLASITFLSELVDSKLVIDITIMGGDGDYAVQLFLADKEVLLGTGSSLPEAIAGAYDKFESKNSCTALSRMVLLLSIF